jgi:hypothetical protein
MATRVLSLVAFSYMSGLLTITNKADNLQFTKAYDPLLPPSWMYRDFAPAFPPRNRGIFYLLGVVGISHFSQREHLETMREDK